ncbi:MAG: NAD(+)/NADH kinase [Acetobacteraceae bacterium]|nr:NAD(+)/NADH kinase [Acetobacteraceae bacterium]
MTGALQVAAPGALGADIAREEGFAPDILPGEARETTAAHTREAAAALKRRGVELILFAGGDGTARDIHAAVGADIPILGIPTGVKMHSAVFGTSPEAASNLAALFATGPAPAVKLREAEVMDIDEEALRAGRVSARLFGYARTPYERHLVQSAKGGPRDEEALLEALAEEVAAAMPRGVLHLVGPGTTTQRVLAKLGIAGTLLGVDAVEDGALVARDLSEADCLRLLDGRPARMLVGVTGGQGFLFGRGNPQFGPEVIRRIGRDNIVILAGRQKLLGLPDRRLYVDTGDPATDAMLAGYARIRSAPGQSTMFPIAASSAA